MSVQDTTLNCIRCRSLNRGYRIDRLHFLQRSKTSLSMSVRDTLKHIIRHHSINWGQRIGRLHPYRGVKKPFQWVPVIGRKTILWWGFSSGSLGMLCTTSLSLLTGLPSPRIAVPVRVPSRGQIELFYPLIKIFYCELFETTQLCDRNTW